MKKCIFCDIETEKIILENKLAVCIPDSYPVTEGHSLIIPRRHISDFFQMTDTECKAAREILYRRKKMAIEEDSSVEGFNIGVNIGSAAGQTVNHCHLHLIPRRRGDSENPAGGVRGVIDGKRDYRKKGCGDK